MVVIVTGFIPVTAVHSFNNGNVGKQPLAWKEYLVDYWLKGWIGALAAEI